jgi:hypothetical protein
LAQLQALLGLPLSIGIALTAPDLVGALLGPAWGGTAEAARVAGFAAALTFLHGDHFSLFVALGKARWNILAAVANLLVPLAALAALRVPAPAQEPEPLPYLREDPWAYDLDLEVELNGTVVTRTSARRLYWSPAQMIAHLTANGASLRTGDLLGSGTISGPERGQRGSLIELSWNGTEPVALAGGGSRCYLEDGDEVVLRGTHLGEVAGRIRPAWQDQAP